MCYYPLVKSETLHWLTLAETDLGVAQVCLDREYYPACVFHAQQALEKLLKAFWVESHPAGVPPRTHDLIRLSLEAGLNLGGWQPFLVEMSRQAVASRYADPASYDRARATEYLDRAKQLWDELRPRLS